MQRREFITLLGGAAAAWPLAAGAQQGGLRRVAVLVNGAEDDPAMQARLAAFRQGLERLGWSEGRNVHLEMRVATSADQFQPFAKEVVALQPEVIFVQTTPFVAALQRETGKVPTVFVSVSDPIGSGFIASLARPGGNLTGHLLIEASITGKWLAMLKEIAPQMTRVGVLRDPSAPGGTGQFGAIQAVAPYVRVEVSALDVREAPDIERGVAAFARTGNGGLILLGGARATVHSELIITLAARHRLPTAYPGRGWVIAGGLISYGPIASDEFRRAAGYVDRILKGEKPADLPVQLPTRYETVLNMKTAKALGLDVPATVLVRADEVIE